MVFCEAAIVAGLFIPRYWPGILDAMVLRDVVVGRIEHTSASCSHLLDVVIWSCMSFAGDLACVSSGYVGG